MRRFREAVSAFFELIESVSKESCPDKPIKWKISVEHGSARVIAHADPGSKEAAVVLKSLHAGVAELEKGDIENAPLHFSERAIRAARKLSVVRERGDEMIPVSLLVGNKRNEITAKTAAAASNLVDTAYQSYGSIEGKLLMLSDEDGFKFAVQQKLFDRRVICFVAEALVPEAIAAFRRRVRVMGRIQYNRVGNPVSLDVGEIIIMPQNSDLPSVAEMRGILARNKSA